MGACVSSNHVPSSPSNKKHCSHRSKKYLKRKILYRRRRGKITASVSDAPVIHFEKTGNGSNLTLHLTQLQWHHSELDAVNGNGTYFLLFQCLFSTLWELSYCIFYFVLTLSNPFAHLVSEEFLICTEGILTMLITSSTKGLNCLAWVWYMLILHQHGAFLSLVLLVLELTGVYINFYIFFFTIIYIFGSNLII